MPTYEYVCEKCGHQFDLFQSMKEEPLKVCPAAVCVRKRWGKGKVKRLLGTGANLLFKGSGFYITDYRSTGYQEAAKKDKAPAPAAAASTTSGDAKATPAKAEAKAAPAAPASKKSG